MAALRVNADDMHRRTVRRKRQRAAAKFTVTDRQRVLIGPSSRGVVEQFGGGIVERHRRVGGVGSIGFHHASDAEVGDHHTTADDHQVFGFDVAMLDRHHAIGKLVNRLVEIVDPFGRVAEVFQKFAL